MTKTIQYKACTTHFDQCRDLFRGKLSTKKTKKFERQSKFWFNYFPQSTVGGGYGSVTFPSQQQEEGMVQLLSLFSSRRVWFSYFADLAVGGVYGSVTFPSQQQEQDMGQLLSPISSRRRVWFNYFLQSMVGRVYGSITFPNLQIYIYLIIYNRNQRFLL